MYYYSRLCYYLNIHGTHWLCYYLKVCHYSRIYGSLVCLIKNFWNNFLLSFGTSFYRTRCQISIKHFVEPDWTVVKTSTNSLVSSMAPSKCKWLCKWRTSRSSPWQTKSHSNNTWGPHRLGSSAAMDRSPTPQILISTVCLSWQTGSKCLTRNLSEKNLVTESPVFCNSFWKWWSTRLSKDASGSHSLNLLR